MLKSWPHIHYGYAIAAFILGIFFAWIALGVLAMSAAASRQEERRERMRGYSEAGRE